jgi:hypothetical protein
MCAEAGRTSNLSSLTLREVFLIYQGYLRRQKKETLRVIGLRNDIRGAIGADQIDPQDMFEGSDKKARSHKNDEELQAMKYRWKKKGFFDKDRTE